MFNGILDGLKNIIVGRKDQALSSDRLNSIVSGNTFDKDSAEKISAVFTCINIRSNTLAKMPISIYKTDENDSQYEDTEDNRYDILHYSVNNYMTTHTFISTLEAHRSKTGNAFARVYRNSATGRPTKLEIINPDRVRAVRYTNGEMYYLLYNTNRKNNIEPVNANNILHFKEISQDGVWGISPIEVLNSNLSVTHKALQTIDNLYENNAMSTKVVQMEHNVDPKKADEALSAFKNSYGGSENAGEIIQVPPFMSLQNIDMNLQDKEFIDTIKYNSRQIASVFGIPPHLVGEYEASKFNNVEQLQLHFKINTISSIKEMYKKELEFKLLTLKERKEGVTIDFDLSKLVETDESTKMDRDTKAINFGMLTPNEVNRKRGWPTYPEGDQHYMNTSMQAVEYYNKKQQAEIDKKQIENKKIQNDISKSSQSEK